MIPLPPQAKLMDWAVRIAALVLLFALGAAVGFAFRAHLGDKALAAERDAEHAREVKQLQDVAKADEATALKEKEHAQVVADLRAQYATAVAEADAARRDRDAALRSGAVGVRIRVRPGSCQVAAVPPGSAASGADGGETAQLDPATAADLEGITRDGDDSIRQLDALQAWARSAVQACNGVTP